MSRPSAKVETPADAPPAPPAPVAQIACRHCGGGCVRIRHKRLGVVLHSFGTLLMLLGYLGLVAKGLFLISWQIKAIWLWQQTGSYAIPDELFVEAEWFAAIAGCIVLGHLLAVVRPAWMCTLCGSLFDRSEQPETRYADYLSGKPDRE